MLQSIFDRAIDVCLSVCFFGAGTHLPKSLLSSAILHTPLIGSNFAVFCSQWDLVCERAYLKDLTQTFLVLGVMFGAVICTILSDKLGRKPIFFYSQWAMVVVGVVNAFAPNYYFFAVFRFCTGMLMQVRRPTS